MATLALVVRPEWGNAASLGTAIGAIFKAAVGDAEAATNAGMVACELAENAIKYGNWSQGDGFTFRLALEGREAVIDVASPYDPASGSFERLQGILRTIGERSAKEAYLQRLTDVAEKSGEVGQLGLLRIAHELSARITASIENNTLSVRAVWQVYSLPRADS
jgi:hypothetical protein